MSKNKEIKRCERCGGTGERAYGSTTTWRGGIGGQAVTSGPCDLCWGSGDENNPGENLRAKRNALITADKGVKNQMKSIAKSIEGQIPDDFGFICLVFPFNSTDGRANYVSNGKRKDAVNAMKEFLFRAGAEEDWMKDID